MRLIDADVFKTEYENLITWVSHRAEKARLREFIKDIQNQPTVKAIPLEYVRKNFANSNFEQTFLLVLHMMESEENEKQTVE